MIIEKTRRGLQTAFVMMVFIIAAAVPAVFAQSGDMPLTASKEAGAEQPGIPAKSRKGG